MKGKIGGPDPETIAVVTKASKVMKHKQKPLDQNDLFGPHSALFELLIKEH